MVLQNYQNLIEMTSNIIDIVAFGVGFKCPRKIHLNTQWGGGQWPPWPSPGSGITVRDTLSFVSHTLKLLSVCLNAANLLLC